ncbi:MAG: hypothetical protein ACSHXZ_02720 [Gammaproteobacteria bacterium]
MFKYNKSLQLASVCVLLLSPIVQADIIEGEDLRDPTRPADAVRPAGSAQGDLLSGMFNSASGLLNRGYSVSFIRAGGSEPVAMINEQLVKTGDMIGEAEVVAIEADSVSLRVNGIVQRVSSFDASLRSKVETPQ